MRSSPKAAFDVAKETLRGFREGGGTQVSAALAFFIMFALPPLLALLIRIVGWVLGESAVRTHVLGGTELVAGTEGAEVARTMLETAGRPGHGVLAAVVGIAALIFGALGFLRQLQVALNRIWGVAPRPVKGVWMNVRARLLSVTVVAGVFVILLVSLVLSVTLGAMSDAIADLTGLSQAAIHLLNTVASFALFAATVAAIYKFLPDARVAWRDALTGGSLTSAFLLVGKLLIGLYLEHAMPLSASGAAATLVIVMLWVFAVAQILLFSAELTQVMARRAGRRIVPDHDAVPLQDRHSAAT